MEDPGQMLERTNPVVLLRGVNNPTRLLAEVHSEGQQRTLGCVVPVCSSRARGDRQFFR